MNANRISFVKVDSIQRWLFRSSTVSLLMSNGFYLAIASPLAQAAIVGSQVAPFALNAAFKPMLVQAPSGLNSENLAPGGIFRPTLRSGSQGAEVTELQAALTLLGYFGGSVDGVYAESTVTAVSRFQQAAGLSQDGIVGPATWDRLFPPTPLNQATLPTPTATPTSQPVSFSKPTASPAPQSVKPAVADFPILKLGMTGPAVTRLQERLKAVGVFTGAIDGVFGEETQAAVKAAQKNFQLETDGVVGSATWSALMR